MHGEIEIQGFITRMSALANLRDVDGLMALYDQDATAFLFGEQLALEGIRRHCTNGYAALRGKFSYTFVPLKIESGTGIAHVSGVEQIEGATETGEFAAKIYATYCLRKVDGCWRIAHQHLSMQHPEQT